LPTIAKLLCVLLEANTSEAGAVCAAERHRRERRSRAESAAGGEHDHERAGHSEARALPERHRRERGCLLDAYILLRVLLEAEVLDYGSLWD
jgi:hypothetical protein